MYLIKSSGPKYSWCAEKKHWIGWRSCDWLGEHIWLPPAGRRLEVDSNMRQGISYWFRTDWMDCSTVCGLASWINHGRLWVSCSFIYALALSLCMFSLSLLRWWHPVIIKVFRKASYGFFYIFIFIYCIISH